MSNLNSNSRSRSKKLSPAEKDAAAWEAATSLTQQQLAEQLVEQFHRSEWEDLVLLYHQLWCKVYAAELQGVKTPQLLIMQKTMSVMLQAHHAFVSGADLEEIPSLVQ